MEQVNPTEALAAFFQSFGVRTAGELSRLTQLVAQGQAAPESLRQAAERMMGEWLRLQLGEVWEARSGGLHTGRAALLTSGLMEVHPELLMASSLPAEWRLKLRQAMPRPTPPAEWSQMHEQSLEPLPALDAVRRFVLPVEARREEGPEVAQ